MSVVDSAERALDGLGLMTGKYFYSICDFFSQNFR